MAGTGRSVPPLRLTSSQTDIPITSGEGLPNDVVIDIDALDNYVRRVRSEDATSTTNGNGNNNHEDKGIKGYFLAFWNWIWYVLNCCRKEHHEPLYIELHVHKVMQLFNSLDPSPFQERDMDDDAVEYIMTYAELSEQHQEVIVRVHLTELPENYAHAGPSGWTDMRVDLQQSIRNFFTYREDVQKRQIRQTIKIGRQSLIFGIIILIVCALIGNVLAEYSSTSIEIISTGITILGWVAFWRPVETLIFGWWPQYLRGRVLHRLSHLTVDLLHVTQV